MKEVAAMIRKHFDGIVAWTQTRQTTGFVEAINGCFKPQSRRKSGGVGPQHVSHTRARCGGIAARRGLVQPPLQIIAADAEVHQRSGATWAAPGHARCGMTSALTAILRVSMRPWPFSMVEQRPDQAAERRRRRLSAREGGKIAEALGDVAFSAGWLSFHQEHIVALSVGDRFDRLPVGRRSRRR